MSYRKFYWIIQLMRKLIVHLLERWKSLQSSSLPLKTTDMLKWIDFSPKSSLLSPPMETKLREFEWVSSSESLRLPNNMLFSWVSVCKAWSYVLHWDFSVFMNSAAVMNKLCPFIYIWHDILIDSHFGEVFHHITWLKVSASINNHNVTKI